MQATPDNTQANDNSENAKAGQPTSALAFKRSREERDTPSLFELSTGRSVTVLRKSLVTMMKVGIIPRDIANRILNTGAGSGKAVTVENIPQSEAVQRAVLEACIVSPKIAPQGSDADYDNNQVDYADFEDVEITEIFQYCTGVRNKNVESFRNK